jgi:hypothetical protein
MPELINTFPDAPLLDLPDVNFRNPLIPVVPELGVEMNIVPLEVWLDWPVDSRTEPPVKRPFPAESRSLLPELSFDDDPAKKAISPLAPPPEELPVDN